MECARKKGKGKKGKKRHSILNTKGSMPRMIAALEARRIAEARAAGKDGGGGGGGGPPSSQRTLSHGRRGKKRRSRRRGEVLSAEGEEVIRVAHQDQGYIDPFSQRFYEAEDVAQRPMLTGRDDWRHPLHHVPEQLWGPLRPEVPSHERSDSVKEQEENDTRPMQKRQHQ